MWKFYVPFYYLYYSRLKTKIDLISWVIIFIVPQFLLTYLYSDFDLRSFAFLFLLSQLIFNTLYEIGYIENDISTTENEQNPTLRLDKTSFIYIKNNYNKIIYFRYAIVFLFCEILYLINLYFNFGLNIKLFLILLVINRVFFYWHNSIRNRLNLLTFIVLAITKYIFPIVLFVNEKQFYLYFISIIMFPLLRIIEHSTHKRYGFEQYAKFIGDHDKFRILYYIIFSFFFFLFYFLSLISESDFFIIISLLIYFLIYRFFSYLLVRKGLYQRDNLKNKDLYIQEEVDKNKGSK